MSNVIILILVYLLQNAHGKCLNSNSDIYQAMISTTVEPSLENITWKDNYYNISTALFPLPSHWSERSHALYIRVWVHFLNASNTGIDFSKTLKFTWSESCIYVVIEPVATTILSHGTIVLQRATASLHITLPPFCSKVNEDAVKERMLSFITKRDDSDDTMIDSIGNLGGFLQFSVVGNMRLHGNRWTNCDMHLTRL
ncbi:uncharacterized protein LOC125572443 [Nematostella vectensis]|uniref:uncharacterized protein LOC125572443 n=1 Tax=Nematostella vectensis TaxID=45351 RepID=UPI002077045A|nr:uncharacterized protein LOC125572443 [Nematostella vectensis]